jgi:hypothetical protein
MSVREFAGRHGIDSQRLDRGVALASAITRLVEPAAAFVEIRPVTDAPTEVVLVANCNQSSHRSLDREAAPRADVVLHEPFALLRDCLVDGRRNRAVAPEDLGAAIVDAERVHAHAIGKNVLLPLPGGPATTIMTGRAGFDAATAGSARLDAGQRRRTHVGRQLMRNEVSLAIDHPHLLQPLETCADHPAAMDSSRSRRFIARVLAQIFDILVPS